jgi:hypothetical protein
MVDNGLRKQVEDTGGVGVLLFISVVAGMCFGVLNAVGMGAGISADVGGMFGATVGFLLSPVLILNLRNKYWATGLVVVCVPTAILTYLAALAGGMLPGFLMSVTSYVGLSIAHGDACRRRLRREGDEHLCDHCGYSLAGLRDARCPECGELIQLTRIAHEPEGASPLNRRDPAR